jgi:hypothetical protein
MQNWSTFIILADFRGIFLKWIKFFTMVNMVFESCNVVHTKPVL